MFRTEEQQLDLVITALQSIAAYPDAQSVEELQAVVRQRLAVIPVPRYHPESPEILTAGYHPQPPPAEPGPWADDGWGELGPLVDAGQDCTCWCVPSLCTICTVQMTCPSCWVIFTGVITDPDGRPICFQFQCI